MSDALISGTAMVIFSFRQMPHYYLMMILGKRSTINQPVEIFLLRVHDNNPVDGHTLMCQFLNQLKKLLVRFIGGNNDVYPFHAVSLPLFLITGKRGLQDKPLCFYSFFRYPFVSS